MSDKTALIQDIQNLLNNYDGIKPTYINPQLLEFMDRETLLSIIDSLLTQKEDLKKSDLEWLETFKIEYNNS